jgi:hypothetical protein
MNIPRKEYNIPYWPTHNEITKVLEEFAGKEINIDSESGREYLAGKITDALWKHYHPNESLD